MRREKKKGKAGGGREMRLKQKDENEMLLKEGIRIKKISTVLLTYTSITLFHACKLSEVRQTTI